MAPAGPVSSVQALPFHDSASAWPVREGLSWYWPTARQCVPSEQEIAAKPLEVAPVGPIVPSRVQDVPFHSSASAPAAAKAVRPPPTAMQGAACGQETPVSTARVGVVSAGSRRQDWPFHASANG